VDRRTAEVTLARELDARGTVVLRASSGWRRDGVEARRIRGPWFTPGADTFRVNRPVNPGSYWHNTVRVDAGANGDAQYLTTGFGGSLLYERGDGALRWQRIEARFNERADVGAITLIARADAGMVIGHDPPYQMLYELGGERTLPGYDYKEFAGDRAVLARGEVRYHLPLWRAPIRLWRFFLPGLAPAIGVGAQSGWTDAWSGTRAKLPALGSRVTGHPRTTYDFRLYLFSGAVNIGAAYGERWRVVGGLSFD
jgi:hypothetical protein